jgi:cell division protein ZapA (FtsZ GTPase activity inhibitor)
MPAEPENVIHQLAVGGDVAVAEIVERAHTTDDVTTVVAAALFAPDDKAQLMARAAALAVTTRDRQLVAIATAHLEGDADRVEDLARDHLADHPDSVLVAWITSATNHATATRKDPS